MPLDSRDRSVPGRWLPSPVLRAGPLLALLLVLLPAAFPVAAQPVSTRAAAGWTAPVLADGVVYVGRWRDAGGHVLLALDAVTGEERWRFVVDHRLEGPATVVDGVVYLGDHLSEINRDTIRAGGTVYALDAATGEERWRAATNRGVRTAPTVVDGVVYLADLGGGVRALDAAAGRERWQTGAGAGPTGLAVTAAAVYIGTGTDDLIAFDAASGEERWRSPLGDGRFAEPVPTVGGVGLLLALDAASGAEHWRLPVGDDPATSPAVGDGVVYVAVWGEGTYAVADAGPARGA